jgi:glycosyltransferase involved in cell wall biosynthesis
MPQRKEKTASGENALLLFVEPTPYILGLIRCIASSSTVRTEVGFCAENLSQQWDIPISGADAFILPKGALAAVWTVSRRIFSGHYRLLHLAGWGEPAQKAALLWAWVLRIPAYLQSDTPLPARSPLWKRLLKRMVYPLMFRIPARLLPGGTLQREYLKHYGVADDRIDIAQMTVDVAGIRRQCAELERFGSRSRVRLRHRIGAEHVAFIFIGRLESHKGIADLLGAFSRLCASRSDAALLVAGDGSSRLLVEKAAATNPAIHYLGRLDERGVVEAMNAADVAVLPSTFEPWGLVVNEAMAAGLPVIASNRVGCRADLVRQDQTGLVFSAGSVDSLLDAMLYMATRPDERKRMAAQARAAIGNWTLENWARNIVKAWESETADENSRH